METKQITSLVITKTATITSPISTFQQTINVPFKPDFIKVSNISPVGTETFNFYKITSDLISSLDNCLPVFTTNLFNNEPMIFTNDRTISGTYNFNIDTPLVDGTFTMTLTFIKN